LFGDGLMLAALHVGFDFPQLRPHPTRTSSA
jgi:hypothetical protein